MGSPHCSKKEGSIGDEDMVSASIDARSNSTRFEGIQALRFVAALLVVITHSTFYTHERLDSSVPVWSFGAIGVDIFFVISGFVMMITAGSFSDPGGWKRFAARRVHRIVPLYWLATTAKLITMLIVPAAVLHAELDLSKVILSYLLLPSTNADGRFEPLLGVGWTLIFEMFFYAVFALGLALRVRLLPFVASILALCVFIGLFRQPGWPAGTMYFQPIVVFFVVGMSLATLVQRCPPERLVAPAVAGLLLLALSVFAFDVDIQAKAKSLPGIIFASLLVMLFVGLEPKMGGRIPQWVIFMGDASYALYLFHPLVSPAVPEILSRIGCFNPTASIVGGVTVALLASALIHLFVERPVTQWLKPYVPYAGRFVSSPASRNMNKNGN